KSRRNKTHASSELSTSSPPSKPSQKPRITALTIPSCALKPRRKRTPFSNNLPGHHDSAQRNATSLIHHATLRRAPKPRNPTTSQLPHSLPHSLPPSQIHPRHAALSSPHSLP
ncbi:hypothetical protein M758_2G230900, partial [Ceratodon purpureus]